MKLIPFPFLCLIAFLCGCSTKNTAAPFSEAYGTPLTAENAQANTGIYHHSSGITIRAPLPAGYSSTSDSTFTIFLFNGTADETMASFAKSTTKLTYDQTLAQLVAISPDNSIQVLTSANFKGFRQKTSFTYNQVTNINYTYWIFFPTSPTTYYTIYGIPSPTWTTAKLAAFDQMVNSATSP